MAEAEATTEKTNPDTEKAPASDSRVEQPPPQKDDKQNEEKTAQIDKQESEQKSEPMKRERKKPEPKQEQQPSTPASTEGKRERKKIERLEFTAADLTQRKLFEIPAGSGTLLGECPVIDHNLQSVKAEDLKVLHKLLFKTPGQLSTIKKNIRRFNGFAFEKSSADYDKKMLLLVKQVLADLKRICHVLDLEKSGTKEELCTRYGRIQKD